MKLRARVVVAAVSLGLVTVAMSPAHAARVEPFVAARAALVEPFAASSAARGEPSATLVEPSAASRADPVASAAHVAQAYAIPHDVTVISFNACGAACRHGEVPVTARHIATLARTADVILLQELCRPQFDRVRKLLPGFRGRYAPAIVGRGCGGTAFGVAVLVRGPVLSSVVLPLPTSPGYEHRNLLGVTTRIGGRRTFVATVHLSPSPSAGLDSQLAAVARYLDGDGPTIVGGDFNSLPEKPELLQFYSGAAGGTGHFIEADEFRNRRPAIGGVPTFDVAERKIDYVFFSAGDFARPSASSEPTALSDHRVYEATARIA
jgi:endonuclease/exonuclease/phosphatase family metal-dependent hydrolase